MKPSVFTRFAGHLGVGRNLLLAAALRCFRSRSRQSAFSLMWKHHFTRSSREETKHSLLEP
jgi:hypothetical protein